MGCGSSQSDKKSVESMDKRTLRELCQACPYLIKDVMTIVVQYVDRRYEGQLVQTLIGHTGAVYSVCVLPNGQLVSGSHDKTLRIWDVKSGDCEQILTGHTNIVKCVCVLPNGQLVSGSWDNTLRIWDVKSGDCVQTLTGHTSSVRCVCVLPNGQLVSGSRDKTLRIWA